jgi:hypothetical protein
MAKRPTSIRLDLGGGYRLTVSFSFDASNIFLSNPQTAGQAFRIQYSATNTGADDPGHVDHVDVWDIHKAKLVDQDVQAPATAGGGEYGCLVDIPALGAGEYDIAITIASGTASAGGTIVVH